MQLNQPIDLALEHAAGTLKNMSVCPMPKPGDTGQLVDLTLLTDHDRF